MAEAYYVGYFAEDEDINDDDLVMCRGCGQAALPNAWIEFDIDCGICGGHLGLGCPNCSATYENIDLDKLKVIYANHEAADYDLRGNIE